MKYPLIFASLIFFYPFQWVNAKSQKNIRIESASQFQNWCKKRSYRHFKHKKQTPYNWSASTIRQLNDYQTTGRWKVNNEEIVIFCQIRKGKRAKQMKMEIQ